jgi:hypothetical protein
MRRTLSVLFGLGAIIVGLVPVWAHHAFEAEFDNGKPVKLQGKVTRMEWINTHTWIHMEVVKEDGTTEEWMIEGGSPNIMLRKGFTKVSLEKGTEIIAEGYLAKNGKNRASGRTVTFKDGKRLFTGGSAPSGSKE